MGQPAQYNLSLKQYLASFETLEPRQLSHAQIAQQALETARPNQDDRHR